MMNQSVKKMHNPMTVGEFIRVTFIETGREDEAQLRAEGFSDVLDDIAVIDDKAAETLSLRFARTKESWIKMYLNTQP